MQKITPHLWFDKEAKEATRFYASIFPDSKIINTTTLHNTPSGDFARWKKLTGSYNERRTVTHDR